MVERQSPEQLIASHEQLSKLVGQREAFTKRLGADSIDFENTTPREVRIFGIRNRVRASIDRLKDSLTAVDSQLDEYLPQIARDYRSELIRKERDLRSIERSGLAVPEETLTGFRSQLQQFRDKPQSDPVLAKALGIKMEQKAPPAPTPPAETPPSKEPEKPGEEEIMLDGQPIKVPGKLTSLAVRMLISTIEGNRIPDVELTQDLYGKVDDQSIKKTKDLLYYIQRTFFKPRGYEISSIGRISVGSPYSYSGIGLNYFLEKIQPKPEEKEKDLTQITFNPENGEFTKDGEVIKKVPKYFGEMIRYLSENKGLEVKTEDFFQVLKDAGSKIKRKNINAGINTLLKRAKEQDQDLGELIQVTKVRRGRGKLNLYSLSPKFAVIILSEATEKPLLDTTGTPIIPVKEAKELDLPNIEEFDLNLIEAKVLKGMIYLISRGERIFTNILAERVWEDEVSTRKKVDRLLHAIRKLKQKVESKDWEIVQLIGRGGHRWAEYGLIRALRETHPEEEPQLPKMVINLETKEVEIDGRLRKVRSQISQAILTNFEDILGQRYITKSRIRQLLKELGAITGFPAGLAIRNLNRTLGSLLITEAGSDKYILNANVTFVGGEATKKDQESAENAEKKKRYQKAYLLYTKTLPDGQTIQIRGKITADCFDAVFSGSKENPVPFSRIKSWHTILRLKKILEGYGYTIIQPVPSQARAHGKTAVYYPEKIAKEETPAPATTAAERFDTLYTQYLRGLIFKEEYQLAMQQLLTEHPELKDDLENKRNALATEINQLQTRIQSIEVSIRDGGLTEKSSPILEALRKAVDAKKVELAEKETLLNSLPLSSSNGDIVEIPYQRPPETIRTADETNLLILIAEELTRHDRLYFDGIQEGLHAYQNLLRIRPVRGTHTRRFHPFESTELKSLFTSAYRKMKDDSQLPLRKKEWSGNEESSWEKLQILLQTISEGDERRFLQRVNALIDRASRDYYDLHSDRKEGEGWVI